MNLDLDSTNEIDLRHLGWTDDLALALAERGEGLVPARVIGGGGARLRVRSALGVETVALAGRLLRDETPDTPRPVVGDWVALRGEGGPIQRVLPRRTCIQRKEAGARAAAQTVAANVDVTFVVTSLNTEFNPRRLERYLAVIHGGGATPVLVLSKADLCDAPEPYVAAARAVAGGADVLLASARTGAGVGAMRERVGAGRTGVLVGSSGVGKSALTNALLAAPGAQREGALRAHDERGRHTTAHRELFALPGLGGLLIDTPGMRELAPWLGPEERPEGFDDVAERALTCRFRDCAHGGEPGCAVEAAVDSGELPAARVEAWRKLRAEQLRLRARADARRSRDPNRRPLGSSASPRGSRRDE